MPYINPDKKDGDWTRWPDETHTQHVTAYPGPHQVWDTTLSTWVDDLERIRSAKLTEIDAALNALDAGTVRPLRAILAADGAGIDRAPEDMEALAVLETQAESLRTTRATVANMTQIADIQAVAVE